MRGGRRDGAKREALSCAEMAADMIDEDDETDNMDGMFLFLFYNRSRQAASAQAPERGAQRTRRLR
jgi:hypothetical protein